MLRNKICDEVLDRRTTLLEDGESGIRYAELGDGPAVRQKGGSGPGEADNPGRTRISSSKHASEILLDLQIAFVIDDEDGRSGDRRRSLGRRNGLRGAAAAHPDLRRVASPLRSLRLRRASGVQRPR